MIAFDAPTWVEVALVIGAMATALLAVGVVAARTGRGLRTVSAWLGAIVRGQVAEVVDDRIAPIVAEVVTNEGGSIKDQVTRTEARLGEHADASAGARAAIKSDLEAHVEHADEQHDELWAAMGPDDPDE